ncbi:DUF342 domain-containing protein [Caldinitratiruptor microaerophilus]|uniref:Polymerase n=1 Tax=Caldinitratiruptor microaerophilus TaxID=671077 RepID=A0AA35G8L1_9FIRM|nr:FapA family protein [Caldinitratiruptor microaerophilus]BDG59374.1 polymerase [Caldinitratiruptor microaerophilus]
MPDAQPQPRPGTVRAWISQDGLAAYLEITPPDPEGKPVTVEDADRALQEAGVLFGIDRQAVERAVAMGARQVPGTRPEPVRVATGKPPENGRDAVIEYHPALTAVRGRPRVLPDGSVDLFDLNIVQNVTKGEVLATKTPPTPGTPGTDVRGHPVPARPGRDVPLIPGEGAAISEDGLQVIAATDGHPILNGRRILVRKVFSVAGDVGPGTGNIRFVGSVVVRGNVLAGYSVKADGDVEVTGGLDGGTIEAGGNVTVRFGIQGAGRGKVIAGGSVRARYIENAEVRAGGDVWVADGILHSRVEAGGRCEVLGRRGSIVGGRVGARDSVAARNLGAPMGTPTEIAVGITPSVRREFDELKGKMAAIHQQLEQVQQALAAIQAQAGPDGSLPPARQTVRMRLVQHYQQLQAQRAELEPRLRELEQIVEDARLAWVQAQDTCYPGVKVTIGRSVYAVTDDLKRVRFTLSEDGEVRIGPI